MQRGLLLGAGAVVLIAGGALALRAVSHHQVTGAAEQKVDRELAELLSGASITHGAIVEDGLTGTATVHDLAVARPDAPSWTAATLVLSGVHAAALRDVFDPTHYPQGRPAWTDRRALLGDLTLNTVRAGLSGPQPGTMTIDRVELHGLRGRPFAQPPTAQNRTQPAFAADAALAFALDSERITNLAVVEQGASSAHLKLGSLVASGYDAGKLAALDAGAVALDTTDAKGTSVHASLGTLSLKGANLTALLSGVQSGAEAPNPAKFSYGSAAISAVAMKVEPGLAVSVHDFQVAQGTPDGTGDAGSHGTLRGLTIDAGDMPLSPTAQANLAAFGMRSITVDIDGAQAGHADGTTVIREDVTLHDLGTLHVSGTLSGYVQPASPLLGSAMAALLAASVHKASLVWDDNSLTGRVFKVVAAQAHTTPAAVRAQLAMPIVALGVMLPGQPDAADQLTHFLDDPHRLTLTLDPAQPVTLGQVAQAPVTQRAQMLGLKIQGK